MEKGEGEQKKVWFNIATNVRIVTAEEAKKETKPPNCKLSHTKVHVILTHSGQETIFIK